MSERADGRLVCRSYTHARRHPQVIGRIGGWTLPSPITPTQLGVLLVSALALVRCRAVWAHLPGAVNSVVLLGLPMALAWLARHLRADGRSPIRFAVGVLSYVGAPRCGSYLGRRTPTLRRTRIRGRVRITDCVASGPGHSSTRVRDVDAPLTVAALRRAANDAG